MDNITRCLKGRVLWYGKARDMLLGTVPWQKTFYWPLGGLPRDETERAVYCAAICGAVSELNSTVDMLSAERKGADARARHAAAPRKKGRYI